ncbi:universal stress protein [Halalkalirubrum salinum]|uniref:universal stress protein n=1 Tax=Halalkalirubrum salinum TaxID=2563889 RepID=UPI00197A9315|nr:universal stress protein [Halalkalirubrum salinum]
MPADTTTAGTLANVSFREIKTEDIDRAVVEYASFQEKDFIMLERRVEELYELYGGGLNRHVLKNAPCGVLLVEDRGFEGVDEIAVATNSGTYDPVKLLVANAIAEETGATLTLLQTVPVDASDERRAVIQEYHDNLRRILTVVADSRVLETDDRVEGLSRFAESADLLVTTTQRRGIQGMVFGRPGDRLVDRVDCTALMVQPPDARKSGLIQRVLIDRLFNK